MRYNSIVILTLTVLCAVSIVESVNAQAYPEEFTWDHTRTQDNQGVDQGEDVTAITHTDIAITLRSARLVFTGGDLPGTTGTFRARVEETKINSSGVRGTAKELHGTDQGDYVSGGYPWDGSREMRHGTESDFGQWINSNSYACRGKYCIYFRFIPNYDKIRTLKTGETLESKITVQEFNEVHADPPHNLDISRVLGTGTVNMTGAGIISFDWDRGTNLNAQSTPEIRDSDATSYSDLEGSVTFEKLTEPTNKTHRLIIESFETTDQTKDPSTFESCTAQNTVDCWRGGSDDVSVSVDNLTGITGMATLAGKRDTYGSWIVPDRETSSSGDFSRDVIFRANTGAVNILTQGTTVFSYLKVTVGNCVSTGGNCDSAGDNQLDAPYQSAIFQVNIVGTSVEVNKQWANQNSISFSNQSTGEITSDGTSTYGDILGKVELTQASSSSADSHDFQGTETVDSFDRIVNSADETGRANIVTATPFWGLEYVVEKNFQFGSWHVDEIQRDGNHCDSNRCRHFVFVPDSDEINKLSPGDTVVSKLQYRIPSQSALEISVIIRGPAVSGSLNLVRFERDSFNVEVLEAESVSLNVKLESIPTQAVTVSYTLDPGTAVAGADYLDPAIKRIVIPRGETSGSIPIELAMDSANEEEEEFAVRLSSADNNYSIRTLASVATINIVDDDAPQIATPGGRACTDIDKPNPLPSASDYVQMYLKDTPDKYLVALSTSNSVRAQARHPTTLIDSVIGEPARIVYLRAYNADGTEATGNNTLFDPTVLPTWGGTSFDLRSPSGPRGFLRYRLLPRPADSGWFDIVEPCEFDVWWVDSTKPGIELSIDDQNVIEGDQFTVRVTATPALNRDLMVPITFSDPSRIKNPVGNKILIRNGETTGTLDVETMHVDGDQSAEELTVTVPWSDDYWLDSSLASDQIEIEDASIVSINNATGSETDGVVFTVTLSDAQRAGSAVSVEYDVSVDPSGGVSKASVDDFMGGRRPNTGTVTFTTSGAATDTMRTFTVLIADDGRIEPLETFTVTLSNLKVGGVAVTNGNIQLAANPTAMGTILDDDGSLVSIRDASGTESTGVVFTVMLASAQLQGFSVSVDYNVTVDPTGGFGKAAVSDFVGGRLPNTGTVTFTTQGNGAATDTMQTFVVMLAEDETPEPSETFMVRLSNLKVGGTAVANGIVRLSREPTAMGTILDEDGSLVNISDSIGTESDGVEFTVMLETAQSSSVSVEYDVTVDSDGGEGKADVADFMSGTLPSTGFLTFTTLGRGSISDTIQTFTVSLQNDNMAEPVELFFVRLFNLRVGGRPVTDGSIRLASDPTAEGRILDEDGIVRIGDSRGTETDGVEFTVTIATAQSEEVSVDYDVMVDNSGEAFGRAEEADFLNGNLPSTGTVTFTTISQSVETDTSQTFTIQLEEDGLAEPEETFIVSLSNLRIGGTPVTDGRIRFASDPTAEGRILDEDGVLVSISDSRGTEADGVEFKVTLAIAQSVGSEVSVNYEVLVDNTNGSGKAEVADFLNGMLPPKGIVTFTTNGSATDTMQTFAVQLAEDGLSEPAETFKVVLSNLWVGRSPVTDGRFRLANDPTAVGEIFDEDSVLVSISDASGTEADGVEFTVTLSEAQTSIVAVSYDVILDRSGGAGKATPDDFLFGWIPATSFVIFSNNGTETDTSQKFTIQLADDSISEPLETFTVRLKDLTVDGSSNYLDTNIRLTTDATAEGRILDDDGSVVSVSDASGSERAGVEFMVNLTEPQSSVVSVDYDIIIDKTSGSGAATAADFLNGTLPSTGTVIFTTLGGGAATDTVQTFTVLLAIDGVAEPSEIFTVKLSNLLVDGSAVSDGSVRLADDPTAEGKILDEDGVLVSIANSSGTEATGVKFIVTIEMAQKPGYEVSVNYDVTVDSSGGAGKASEADFLNGILPTTGTVTFNTIGGETDTRQTFTIMLAEDGVPESSETFTVTLTNLKVRGTLVTDGSVRLSSNPTAEGTIFDDVATVETIGISVSKANASVEEESATAAVFTIESNFEVTNTLVRYYVSQVGYHIFGNPGNSIKLKGRETTLRIPLVDNLDYQARNGSVTVTLQRPNSATYILDGDKISAKVDIINDDREGITINGFSVAGAVIVDILRDMQDLDEESTGRKSLQLPEISIAAATGSVEEGGFAVFSLSSSKPAEEELKVNITLTDIGDFIGGNNSRKVNIAEGRDTGELNVATVNDDHAGDDGSIIATVADGYGYEIGSDSSAEVVVTDFKDREIRRTMVSDANQAIMSELTGSRIARTLETATNRVTSAFSIGSGIKLELGGNTTISDLIREGGNLINGEEMDSWQKVLGESSFEFGLLPEKGTSNLATVWGHGDFRYMSTNGEGAGELDGDIFTGHLGFDTLIGDDMVAGLTTSHSRGEFDYGIADEDALSYTIRTTGVHPYYGLETFDGNRLQIIAGFGVGAIELDQEGYETEFLDSNYASFGASGSRVLYSGDSLLLGGTSEFSLEGESWMARQFLSNGSDVIGNMKTDARHLRISTVGTHEYELESGMKVSPSVSMGLREDGKLGESFIGMEVGGGIVFANPYGYEISTKGEMLFAGIDQVQEWGMSGQMSYDSANDGLGVQLIVAPEWGRNMLNSGNALWGDSVLVEGFDSSMHTNGAQINAEIGYGLTLWENLGLLKPYGGVFLSEKQEDKYRVGTKLNLGSGIEFELESSRILGDSGADVDEFKLDGRIKW